MNAVCRFLTESSCFESTINLHPSLLSILFNLCIRLSIYGSCLSNLSLGVGADVDLSLWIPEMEKAKNGFQQGDINARTYERDTKKFVYQVFHTLRNRDKDFKNMQAITRARGKCIVKFDLFVFVIRYSAGDCSSCRQGGADAGWKSIFT
jgi:hypothetical protein